jgi:hypothetical protein
VLARWNTSWLGVVVEVEEELLEVVALEDLEQALD